MNNSIIYPQTSNEPVVWAGTGNSYDDPLLVNIVNPTDLWTDFQLQPGSPALSAGPNGVDIGGVVPAGASIAGAKNSAFGSSARYSSHPDESTTFTPDLPRAQPSCRCREGIPASHGWDGPE